MLHEEIRFIKLSKDAIAPTYGTGYSAGADLHLLCDGTMTIHSGETVLIHTGIALEIPEGYAGLVFARSGFATKMGIAPANKVGVIDSDYRGEIMVPLHNHGRTPQTIQNGERVAQIVIVPYVKAAFVEAESLSESDRGQNGFGSTGMK